MRRFRCFVFDLQMKLRSSHASKPKRTVTPFMYMCLARLCPIVGFQPSALPPTCKHSPSELGSLLLLRSSVQQGFDSAKIIKMYRNGI